MKPAEFRRPVETPVPAPALPKAPATGLDESLESRIGGRWLLYIGTAALVIGIGFFVKYAFDNDWIGETGRVLIGAAIGLAMILGGHRIARRGYPLYGQIVAGGGFAALYISVFAALAFYGLIGRPAAFGLMVLVTAGAALAADAHRSLGLALFAAAGGFLTPFLVGGDENAQIVLLSYDAILAIGTMVMASRRNWPILNVVSYAFVLGTFASWADSYYTPAQWVPTQVFLTIFGALFTGAGLRAQRAGTGSAGMVGVLLVTAPIIFHAASVANLQPHWLALLLYLTLASVTGVAASMKLDSAWLRLAVFAFVAPVLWQWIGEHAGPGWLLAPAAVALAIYAMNLVAIGERLARQAGRWLKADLVLFHGSALGLFAGLYAIFDPVATSSMPLLALALAAWHGGLTWFWRGTSEEAGLNSLAVAFAMLGFAIGLQFDLWWSVVGWAIEAAAIVWVGLKSRRDWMRLGGALLLAWAVLLLVQARVLRGAGRVQSRSSTRGSAPRWPWWRSATSWRCSTSGTPATCRTGPARRSPRCTSSATCSPSCCSRPRSVSTGRCGKRPTQRRAWPARRPSRSPGPSTAPCSLSRASSADTRPSATWPSRCWR